MKTIRIQVLIAAGIALATARLMAAEPAGEAGAHEEHPHQHHVGVFLGGMSRFEHGHKETGGAIGLEYEYRLAPRWGLGALFESVAVGEGRDLALVAPLSWHPWRGLKFSVGPGVEFNGHKREFLGRVSAGYDFRIGRLSLAPEVSGDFTREAQTLVYGVTLGYGF